MPPTLYLAWWREVRYVVLCFVPLAMLFALTDLDLTIAHALFFDASRSAWIGAHHWWIEQFLHDGGRWAIRIVVFAALVMWVVSGVTGRWREMRRAVAYFVIATVLAIAVVGLLKVVTNVDCPWDLTPFGGRFPFVALFGDRPDALRAARCFPAAHASSGYALVALYFAARERSRTLARAGLAFGIFCGAAFGLAQQARGAHFMSHDLWSALIVWMTVTAVYVFGFRMRLHAQCDLESADATSGRVRASADAVPVARV